MKTKVILILLLFALMCAVPVIALNTDLQRDRADRGQTTPDGAETEALSEEKLLKGMLFARYSEETPQEALKAQGVIFATNCKADPKSVDFQDGEKFLSEERAKEKYGNSYEEISDKITEAINSVKEIYIYYNGEVAYIPYADCSSGYTQTDEKYPYLISVASPWDCLSEDYSQDNVCTGVSLNGIEYLTNNGCDYTAALKRYLPGLEIK